MKYPHFLKIGDYFSNPITSPGKVGVSYNYHAEKSPAHIGSPVIVTINYTYIVSICLMVNK